jgi:hypothetical protein
MVVCSIVVIVLIKVIKFCIFKKIYFKIVLEKL